MQHRPIPESDCHLTLLTFSPYHSQYLAHRLTLEGVDDDAFAKALTTARVDMNPHQVDAALFALESPLSKGVILKGERLIGELPFLLDAVASKGGARKAVIFTESVRTQTYLAQLLAEAGFAAQTALLNGSNSDPGSQRIYADCLARHVGTDGCLAPRPPT